MQSPLGGSAYTMISNSQDHAQRESGGWFNTSAVDLHAPVGTAVTAMFDGVVTKVNEVHTAEHDGTRFGAQIFMVSKDGTHQAFFTHIENVPSDVKPGASITAGTVLGTITAWSGHPNGAHVHVATAVKEGSHWVGVNPVSILPPPDQHAAPATPAPPGVHSDIIFTDDEAGVIFGDPHVPGADTGAGPDDGGAAMATGVDDAGADTGASPDGVAADMAAGFDDAGADTGADPDDAGVAMAAGFDDAGADTGAGPDDSGAGREGR